MTSEENSPAYTSLIFAIANYDNFISRRERHSSNLLTLLKTNMNNRNWQPDNISDVENLKEIILKELNLPQKKSATMITRNTKKKS